MIHGKKLSANVNRGFWLPNRPIHLFSTGDTTAIWLRFPRPSHPRSLRPHPRSPIPSHPCLFHILHTTLFQVKEVRSHPSDLNEETVRLHVITVVSNRHGQGYPEPPRRPGHPIRRGLCYCRQGTPRNLSSLDSGFRWYPVTMVCTSERQYISSPTDRTASVASNSYRGLAGNPGRHV